MNTPIRGRARPPGGPNATPTRGLPGGQALPVACAIMLWITAAVFAADSRIVSITGDDLQGAIDRARPGDTLMADPQREIVVSKSVVIDKPLRNC
jgi:hypothetical protein